MGPTVGLKGSGVLVFLVTMRAGDLVGQGRHYGGPKGTCLEGARYFDAAGGAQWQTYARLYRFSRKDVGATVLMLSSKGGVQLGALRVLGFTDAVEAWKKTYALYRQPAASLLANGAYEKTQAMKPAQAKKYREELKWQLGPGKEVVLPEGCTPHSYWKGKRLVLIDDPSKAHSGRRCVEFTLFRGEPFAAKPDRSYLVSLWLRGQGTFSLFASAYGGPKGGFLGNLPIVSRADKWTLGPKWRKYRKTVQLEKAGHNRLGLAPVFVVSGGVGYVDDISVVELESSSSLLDKVRRARHRLEEVFDVQIEMSAKQKQAVDFFLAQAKVLERKLATPDAADPAALAHQAAALDYVITIVKKEVLFGD